jgi:glycosyltransferase involved in cell wall biosynthesis
MSEQPESSAILKVALDGTPLLGQPTGVGVFAASLIEALHARPDVEASSYAVSWRTRGQLATRVPQGVSTEQRAMPARPLKWLWSHSDRGQAERFLPPVDVLHGTNFSVPPSKRSGRVLTVHDLTCVRFPELCEADTLRYPSLIRRALNRGAIIHTPSTSVADEVREHFGVGWDQVMAVHSGVPLLAHPDRDAARTLVDQRRPYILSVGTAEPRKDLPGLVAAFDDLAAREPDVQLVLVGPSGWGSGPLDEAIQRSKASDRIIRTGFVPDATLAGLLAGARALAYPSLYEGFGFPPLQAMAAGVPVVATHAGALTETVGGAALMVEPRNLSALAEALEVAAFDDAKRGILITAGLARVADFTWEATAEGMMNVYRRAVER